MFHSYTRSPSQDFCLFGPRPWKVLATTYEQKTISEQPRPWRTSCERESSYGDRVYCHTSKSQFSSPGFAPPSGGVYILQRGVQWKRGVVFCTMLCTSLLYNTTPIHCTPLPLHPPLQSILGARLFVRILVSSETWREASRFVDEGQLGRARDKNLLLLSLLLSLLLLPIINCHYHYLLLLLLLLLLWLLSLLIIT